MSKHTVVFRVTPARFPQAYAAGRAPTVRKTETKMTRRRRPRESTLRDALEMYTSPEPMSGCWLWTGTICHNGYGQLTWNGKVSRAHRLSFELATGKSAVGFSVCHKCDNRCCVNPDHLFIGTQKDNLVDMVRKGRANKPFGEKHHSAVLTDAQVEQIRFEYVMHSREHGTNALARKYGVTSKHIWLIVNGKSRKRAA